MFRVMILLKNQHSDHWGTWKEPLKHMVGLLDPNPVVLHEKNKTQKKVKLYSMGYHASGEKC
jgi:hypothetical protein